MWIILSKIILSVFIFYLLVNVLAFLATVNQFLNIGTYELTYLLLFCVVIYGIYRILPF